MILLDLVMPETGGLELLNTLRSDPRTKNTPVIVVSGKDLRLEERTRLAQEVDSVWMKGMLDRNSFLTHVETLLTK